MVAPQTCMFPGLKQFIYSYKGKIFESGRRNRSKGGSYKVTLHG